MASVRCSGRLLPLREQTLKPAAAHVVTPFPSPSSSARWAHNCRRRPLVWAVSEAPAEESAASTSSVPDIDKDVIAEKARAGMHRFAASTRKVGGARLVVDSLHRVSLTILGDDHELTCAAAKVVGSRLGWFSVDMAKIICGMRKVESINQLSKDEQAATEAEVLRGLRSQFRVIATPFPGGAVTNEATWKDLWGSVIIWIDEEDKLRPKAKTPERALYESKAEVVVRVKVQKGFAQKGGNTLANRAKAVADALIPRLSDHLAEFPQLTERKRQYVERGCRGDWPDVQPAGWDPLVQELSKDRKPLSGFEQQAERQEDDQPKA